MKINKYLRRGLALLIGGVALIALGYYLMENDIFKYGWAMILGYLAFGIGFLYIIYSFMRKIERRSLLRERAEEDEQPDERPKSEE